jgi:L-seryl-tRNA(Ser) seleniumtransferase
MDLKASVNSDPRRSLPSVDRLIHEAAAYAPDLAAWALNRAAKSVLSSLRARLAVDRDAREPVPGAQLAAVELSELRERVIAEATLISARHPRGVLNATGILLHTNLGRAPLAPAAQDAIAEAARGYSNLELDLATGRRGSRLGRLEEKLVALSGAEAAHVVNNCAAALLLALNTLALGRNVVVSRGELVEIGGSFRVPAIMERAGVALVEVGTTNRTHLRDYAAAIGSETALLLKVHQSNFEQRGFVAEADVRELAELAHRSGIPLIEDLGSGTLVDLGSAGLPAEAFVPSRLAQGVDLLCFSGDKLLGGPQAGILLGRQDLIEAARSNPLARALRIDKLTVAALDATLDLMLEPSRNDEIPVLVGLRRTAAALRPRAVELLDRVSPILRDPWRARLAESEAAVGGGSLPEHRLEGWAVVIEGDRVQSLAERLRVAPRPVLARVHDDSLWLDVRTLLDEDLPVVAESLAFAVAE